MVKNKIKISMLNKNCNLVKHRSRNWGHACIKFLKQLSHHNPTSIEYSFLKQYAQTLSTGLTGPTSLTWRKRYHYLAATCV